MIANFLRTVVAVLHGRIDEVRDNSSDRGATAVEYALMVALIAIAIIAAVTALGGQLNTLFTSITGSL